jgi:hypothetical protein
MLCEFCEMHKCLGIFVGRPTTRAVTKCAKPRTAEKGVAQAKDTYEKAKVAAEEATDLKDTYATAAKAVGRQNHNPSRSCVRRRRYQHPIPPCWMAATAACDTALPNAGNGDFGTSPIYGQLSDKPLLAFIELHGVPNANHNSGSRS